MNGRSCCRVERPCKQGDIAESLEMDHTSEKRSTIRRYLMTFAEGNYPYTSTNRGADVDRREERSSAILPSSARTVVSSISLRIRSACSAAPDKLATRAHAARMAIRTGSGNVNFLFIASALAAAEGSTLNVTRDGVGTGYRPSSIPQT